MQIMIKASSCFTWIRYLFMSEHNDKHPSEKAEFLPQASHEFAKVKLKYGLMVYFTNLRVQLWIKFMDFDG